MSNHERTRADRTWFQSLRINHQFTMEHEDDLFRSDGDINVNGVRMELKRNSTEYTARPFTVHLVLHSHVDPGWLRTFEEYFQDNVRTIIDGAVRGLTRNKNLKFIWSETSFLERWWRDANSTMKDNFKKLLREGRLELCGGAWVMTDEATPHFFSTIDNMIEGQQYVYKETNTIPRTSWSVDPFGHGTMMPLLLPLTGIDNMVVGRLNDILKESLRKTHQLRWKWLQPYNMDDRIKAPYVNSLPYLYYTTSNACGPNEQICCEAHVGISANHYRCDGGMDGYIKQGNVDLFRKYVRNLVEQWKVLQTLYDSDEVLVPLGDDFYLTVLDDWDLISSTWAEFFKIVNNDPSYGVKVQFSTVSEYFDAIKNKDSFPKLNGDFFPYISDDISAHKYWVGYFTHRPHHKRMERILMSQLRVLDLLKVVSVNANDLGEITIGRRNLALFQHHDGITGTSKPHVMDDYLNRMRYSSSIFLAAQSRTIAGMLNESSTVQTAIRSPLDTDREQPPHVIFNASKTFTLLVFNQNVIVRMHKVMVLVDRPHVTVMDSSGKPVQAQISPHFDGKKEIVKQCYELTFFASLPALFLSQFTVRNDDRHASTTVSKIVSNVKMFGSEYEVAPADGETNISTDSIKLSLKNGAVESAEFDGVPCKMSITYETYKDSSGAYVFEAVKEQTIKKSKLLYISKGPLEIQIVSMIGDKDSTSVWQVVRLFNFAKTKDINRAIEVQLFPWAEKERNIFMRITSNISNKGLFSTDVNAMYFQERLYSLKHPLAANIFATPTAGFIQDSTARLTVLTAQPCGMSSFEDGSLLVHVDRRLSGDDGKGLSFEDAMENRRAHTRYRILLEPRTDGYTSGCCHSIHGQNALDTLLFEPAVFKVDGFVRKSDRFHKEHLEEWPCAVQLVNMRFLNENEILVVLRRVSFDRTLSDGTTCSQDLMPVWDFLSSIGTSLKHTSLTGTKDAENVTIESLADVLKESLSIASIKIMLQAL